MAFIIHTRRILYVFTGYQWRRLLSEFLKIINAVTEEKHIQFT